MDGIAPVVLRRDELVLRPWRRDDAPALAAVGGEEHIQRWLNFPSPYRLVDAERWVGELAPALWASARSLPFGVFDAADGSLLAAVGLHSPRDLNGCGELGYWAAAAACGRGVVTRAARLLAEWAFRAAPGGLGLGRLDIITAVDNDAARRVAERLGATLDAPLLRSRLVHRGTRWDAVLYGLLPSDGASTEIR